MYIFYSYLKPGKDVHQAVFSHCIHYAFTVLQHGNKLCIPSLVSGVEAQGAHHISDSSDELWSHVQRDCLEGGESLTQRGSFTGNFMVEK